MGNYRNFTLTTYFVAAGVGKASKEQLEQDIRFFEKHLRLDKVYIEPFRDGLLATDEQIELVKSTFEAHGIRTSGGLTANIKDLPGQPHKQRIFDTFCYTDEAMLGVLREAVARTAKHFDEIILDDFFFTNCTCDSCRAGKDAYNAANGITDGSWEGFRLHLMQEVSIRDIIQVAKAVNPKIHTVIKYPNWMESYQETGYNPGEQSKVFDGVYTGTETRDPIHQDQHLPRYLSFSLMRYFEALMPGKNGGGWFDPFDCLILEHYLEQAYLTAFSKPQELMMFCFQALLDSMNIAALGHQLDKLDAMLDYTGNCLTLPCYIPHNAQGEDNVQDYLGMSGIPLSTTPIFPADAPALMLTRASAYDPDIVQKLERYVVEGGRAIVTSGFVEATLDRGLKAMTSIRPQGRKVEVSDYFVERNNYTYTRAYPHAPKSILMPVFEFRNNATWANVKGVKGEESFAILMCDTYGKGDMLTFVVPDAFSDIRNLPVEAMTRLRREMAVGGMYLDGAANISLFVYDNDAVIVYPYASHDAQDEDILLHVKGDVQALVDPIQDKTIEPLYKKDGESVFQLRTKVGHFRLYQVKRG